MIKKIIIPVVLILFSMNSTAQQEKTGKKDPAGQWKFEAPYAPEGYTAGALNVSLAEKKYAVTMEFTGMDYKFNGDKVSFAADSLSFIIYVEGESVSITLKMEEAAKMSGKAVYSEGVVPLSFSKAVPKPD